MGAWGCSLPRRLLWPRWGLAVGTLPHRPPHWASSTPASPSVMRQLRGLSAQAASSSNGLRFCLEVSGPRSEARAAGDGRW